MGVTSTDRKRELFGRLIRLRRAERAHPEDRDIAAVRAALEDDLGRTVSKNMAASLLGLSHTALSRWVKSGDVATVPTPDGREHVPLDVLYELWDSIESNGRRGHPLEPAMRRGRERAARLAPDRLVSDVAVASGNHERAARRSLAYHRAIAQRLRRETVNAALRRVWLWRDGGQIDPVYAERWEQLLRRPLPEIRRAIGADTPEARDLRQNSPFAGGLSEPERRKIFETIR